MYAKNECKLSSTILPFISVNRIFALSLNKISGTSAIKMKVSGLSFCIALGLDKILTLGNVNKFPFLSLNRFFALSLQTI